MDEELGGNQNGIITLQCGHYSNFIGAHLWNIQKSAKKLSQSLNESRPNNRPLSSNDSNGIFFREGLSGGKEVARNPRLVCIDLKGSLNALNEDGSFQMNDQKIEHEIGLAQNHHQQQDKKSPFPSPGEIHVHRTDKFEKNRYLADITSGERLLSTSSKSANIYNLDSIVNVWSDYLGTPYHQKSVLLLDRYSHGEDMNNFNSFGLGYSMNTDDKFWDSFEDKMHFFAEECDTLQGFQVLVDLDDGFGGLGARVLQNLRDIYGPKAIALFGSWPEMPSSSISQQQQMVNSAMALGHLSQESTMFVPLTLQEKLYGREKSQRCFPYLDIDANSHYHSSAILASYINCITKHFSNGNSSLSDFCNSITKTGHKIASSGFALPIPSHSNSISKCLHGITSLYDTGLLQSLTPSQKASRTVFSQQIVLSGFAEKYQTGFSNPHNRPPTIASNREDFEKFIFNSHSTSSTVVTLCEQPLNTELPFPQFFDARVRNNGFLQSSQDTSGNIKQNHVSSAPTLASVYTTDGLFDTLYDVIKPVQKLHKSKVAMLEQSGIEVDELAENVEALVNIAQCYDEKQAYELF